jgi:hypothetical protein
LDPAHAGGAVVLLDVGTDKANVRTGRPRGHQSEHRLGHLRRSIAVGDPMPAAAGAQMLTQELASLWIDQPDVEIIPLDLDAPPEPAGRRAVVHRLDFDAAIEMDRADAEAVLPKRLERERPELGRSSANIAATCASSCRGCAYRPWAGHPTSVFYCLRGGTDSSGECQSAAAKRSPSQGVP